MRHAERRIEPDGDDGHRGPMRAETERGAGIEGPGTPEHERGGAGSARFRVAPREDGCGGAASS